MSESERSPTEIAIDSPPELVSRAAAAPFQLSQEPHTARGEPQTLAPPAPAFEHLGELPKSYGSQSLYLVAYDPRQLFAYWDVDWAAAGGKQYALQVLRVDGSVETRVDLSPSETSRYLGIREPGGRYSVELTLRGRDGQWRTLATSGPVVMPPEGVAPESEPAFATLPFHLSFQRLIDLLNGAMRPRESITDVLARLQRGGQLAASSLLGALGSLAPEQLHTLELLVQEGFDPADASAPSSGAGGNSGGLSSPGGRFGVSAAAGGLSSASLNSEVRLAAAAAGAFSSGILSSETLSSGGRVPGPLRSAPGLGSEALASGVLARRALYSAAGLGSEALSSARPGLGPEAYTAAAARGSEILSSASRPGFGLSSEAWRMAGGAAVGSSETLAGNQASLFARALEANLEVLSSLFSRVDAQLNGDLGGSSSAPPTSSGRW